MSAVSASHRPAPTLTQALDEFLPKLTTAAHLAWDQVLAHPLLQLALAGICLVLLGGILNRIAPFLAGLLRGFGNLGLIAALLLTVTQVMRIDTGIDLLDGDQSKVEVSGKETRVNIGEDGHFWLRGTIDGTPARFLVDTGATITTLDPGTARRAHLEPDADARQVVLNTANGTVNATRTTIASLRIGSIAARELGAVVSPGMDGTNVLGMNFLSQLASWRVEGHTLILVPHHPVVAAKGAEET